MCCCCKTQKSAECEGESISRLPVVFVLQAGIRDEGRQKTAAVLLAVEMHVWSCNSRFVVNKMPEEAGRIWFRLV